MANARRTLIGHVGLLLFAALILCGPAVTAEEQVTGVTVRHEAGQTFLTWHEVDPPVTEEAISARRLGEIRRQMDQEKRVRYRIYRSDRPIESVAALETIAKVPALTCWNADFHGVSPKPEAPAYRYVIEEGEGPLPPGTGIYAHNPKQPGSAYYAVTVVIAGKENTSITASNRLAKPVRETVGQGVPVVQRIERPEQFNYVEGPTLHYYVRWESPPNCTVEGKPYDYLVAVPPNVAEPAPVGIHLHCWGANLNSGYGWWYQAEQGHLLIASNQIPYDWWTGYHERYWDGPADEETWKTGVVRPYSQTRMLSFLDWVATKWDVDLRRTHVAGNSMGGSGAPMLAIRHPERIAWCTSWVGIHNPAKSPHFRGSYERVYGKPEWGVGFEDGTPVWDYFNDARYLREHPGEEIGLICFSNGKNDGAIGWEQAAEFFRALQETKRPHIFVWGQGGHGQRARLPVSLNDRWMPMDLRTDQSLPAFTACSLDDKPGDGDPDDGDPEGQANLYLFWETGDVVDRADRWEITVGLVDRAPEEACTVDITPRRLQELELRPDKQVTWTNLSLPERAELQTGKATVNRYGLVTLEKVRVTKTKNRIVLQAARG